LAKVAKLYANGDVDKDGLKEAKDNALIEAGLQNPKTKKMPVKGAAKTSMKSAMKRPASASAACAASSSEPKAARVKEPELTFDGDVTCEEEGGDSDTGFFEPDVELVDESDVEGGQAKMSRARRANLPPMMFDTHLFI